MRNETERKRQLLLQFIPKRRYRGHVVAVRCQRGLFDVVNSITLKTLGAAVVIPQRVKREKLDLKIQSVFFFFFLFLFVRRKTRKNVLP
jgi:hypothetical protein